MRISYRYSDPGFDMRTTKPGRVTVFFDGVPQSIETGRDVISADDESGELRYYAYENGKPVPHPTKIASILERVEIGTVVIQFNAVKEST